MIIKNGYNGKETLIKISGRRKDKIAEFWIEQTGLSDKETLSYISIEELIDLKEEIEQALIDIIGLTKND